jgi:hypothetical protein
MTTPSTHRFLVECPETGEMREPTQVDLLRICAGYNLGGAIGQLVHIGETPEKIRARVEEILESLIGQPVQPIQ